MSDADEYWTEDVQIGEGTFRYYHDQPRQVWARVHESLGPYSFERHEQAITPVTHLRGTRRYVHAQVFTWEPELRFTVGLWPRPAADGSIGQVVGTEQRGQRRQELGKAQAWYYPADGLMVLWECFYNRFYRDAPLLEDANMAALWQGLERWLAGCFPQAQWIATPFRDPLFETSEYQAFLRRLGYAPVAQAAFGKALEPQEGSERCTMDC